MTLANATCRFHIPALDRDPDNERQRLFSEQAGRERRCSLRRTNIATEATAFGAAATAAFTCRLVTDLPVAANWKVEAKLDSEADWREYIVRRASRGYHTDLLVERTQ